MSAASQARDPRLLDQRAARRPTQARSADRAEEHPLPPCELSDEELCEGLTLNTAGGREIPLNDAGRVATEKLHALLAHLDCDWQVPQTALAEELARQIASVLIRDRRLLRELAREILAAVKEEKARGGAAV